MVLSMSNAHFEDKTEDGLSVFFCRPVVASQSLEIVLLKPND